MKGGENVKEQSILRELERNVINVCIQMSNSQFPVLLSLSLSLSHTHFPSFPPPSPPLSLTQVLKF